MMKLRWILFLLFSGSLNPCFASDPQSAKDLAKEVKSLQGEIKKLEIKIDHLYELIAALKNSTPTPPKTRNPFDVPDVISPDGQDVQESMGLAEELGKTTDENASPWVDGKSVYKRNPNAPSIDGEWMSRWNMGAGTKWVPPYAAKIQTVGDRVYVFYRDHQGRFLGDFKRHGPILAGRLVGVDNPTDRSVVILKIVSPERIDGSWRGQQAGRIDFRRNSN